LAITNDLPPDMFGKFGKSFVHRDYFDFVRLLKTSMTLFVISIAWSL
jgi:hypothetical protein